MTVKIKKAKRIFTSVLITFNYLNFAMRNTLVLIIIIIIITTKG